MAGSWVDSRTEERAPKRPLQSRGPIQANTCLAASSTAAGGQVIKERPHSQARASQSSTTLVPSSGASSRQLLGARRWGSNPQSPTAPPPDAARHANESVSLRDGILTHVNAIGKRADTCGAWLSPTAEDSCCGRDYNAPPCNGRRSHSCPTRESAELRRATALIRLGRSLVLPPARPPARALRCPGRGPSPPRLPPA